VKRYLSRLIPPSAKPRLRSWLGVPDLEAALGRLQRAGFRPSSAIDVGAFAGDWTVMCRRYFPGARVLMIEPQPDRAAALQALAARLPDVRFVAALVGSGPAPAVPFFQNETVSSVLPEADNVPAAAPVTMPMTTLDAVVTDTGFGAAEFLKLDVQGYELLEVNVIAINRGAPLLHETVAYMAAHGFRVYDICTAIRRPLDAALWQTDMLFVRDSSSLVASTRWG
jgi:FkbM family methyltransferase